MTKKIIFLPLLFFSILILTSCQGVDLSKVSNEDLSRISDSAVKCNTPYIRVGTSCCLDINNNNICDTDESKINAEAKSPEEDAISHQKIDSSPNQNKIDDGDLLIIKNVCVAKDNCKRGQKSYDFKSEFLDISSITDEASVDNLAFIRIILKLKRNDAILTLPNSQFEDVPWSRVMFLVNDPPNWRCYYADLENEVQLDPLINGQGQMICRLLNPLKGTTKDLKLKFNYKFQVNGEEGIHQGTLPVEQGIVERNTVEQVQASEEEDISSGKSRCSGGLTQYPETFITDGALNGFLVIGRNAPKTDDLAATNIVQGMTYEDEFGETWHVSVIDGIRRDNEIDSVTAQNLIAIGSSCSNSVIAELLGNPSDCNEGLNSGEGHIKLIKHPNDTISMLIMGRDASDIKLAAQFVAHRPDDLSGNEVIIKGTSWVDATITCYD